MAFNISSLNNYVEEDRLPLYKEFTAKADTVKYLSSILNVKSETNLNLLQSSPVIQDRGCGLTASGDTTFSARTLKVRRAEIFERNCIRDLESTWMNSEIRARVNGDEAFGESEIAREIVDAALEKAALQIENDLWSGTTATTGFDGFLAIAAAASGETLVATTSADTVWDKVQKVYKAVPASVRRKVQIFMSLASLDELVLELIQKGLVHPDFNAVEGDENNTIAMPGFKGVQIHGVAGLGNSSVIFAANKENLFYGCDAEDDAQTMKGIYDEIQGYWYLKMDFNYGVQIAFPNLVRYAE